MEQAELHWPSRSAAAIAAIESSREEHILCADQDCRLVRTQEPFARIFTAHHSDNARSAILRQPPDHVLCYHQRLFDEHTHRQAPHEPPWPGIDALYHSVIQPR